MKVYDCKCEDCKAEFQAVMDDVNEEIECPSCSKTKIQKTETDIEFGCGGGCGSCGGCH